MDLDIVSKAGVEAFLKDTDSKSGLDTLHFLGKLRTEAYKNTNELLDQFIVYGRWVLDGSGGVANLLERSDGKVIADYFVRKPCPKVLTLDEAKLIAREDGIGYSFLGIPYDANICLYCEKQWSLKNAHEAILIGEHDFAHHYCHRTHIAIKTRDSVSKAITKAGYVHHHLADIPNEYDGKRYDKHYPSSPWFSVSLFGLREPIKIGWRRHVINIDWSSTGKLVDSITTDSVTMDDYCIHAYGYDKLTEYLTKLIPRLLSDD